MSLNSQITENLVGPCYGDQIVQASVTTLNGGVLQYLKLDGNFTWSLQHNKKPIFFFDGKTLKNNLNCAELLHECSNNIFSNFQFFLQRTPNTKLELVPLEIVVKTLKMPKIGWDRLVLDIRKRRLIYPIFNSNEAFKHNTILSQFFLVLVDSFKN